MVLLVKRVVACVCVLALASCVMDTIRWVPIDSVNGGKVVRINFGRVAPYKDSAGRVWLGDQGIEGGDVVDRGAEVAIKGTRDPDLYRTEHWGMESFTYPLPNGRYLVKMYFAETSEHVLGPGQRVFDIDVQGKVIKDFDPYVKAGGWGMPYMETVPVVVTDGKLRIGFTVTTEQTEINAVEIVPVAP